jgi:hypothetical protein
VEIGDHVVGQVPGLALVCHAEAYCAQASRAAVYHVVECRAEGYRVGYRAEGSGGVRMTLLRRRERVWEEGIYCGEALKERVWGEGEGEAILDPRNCGEKRGER